MKLTIEIDTNNDAFADGKMIGEVQSIIFYALLELNSDIESHPFHDKFMEEMGLRDSNGNHVGTLTYK
ncbi:MAG: hypothetical protein A4E27_01342 [Methanobacterium sp. PtaU1.Bin242]|nr:MAG: hypothetical protein A4E27_01342 [Methanobacterium sp. PtaU1.Bin242]